MNSTTINTVVNHIQFPEFTGIKCNMMPFIQGDASSLPKEYQPYAQIINDNFLEKGEIGFLTIDESFVEANKTQRGFNSAGIKRNVHIEVGRKKNKNRWGGGNTWGDLENVLLANDTKILIANNISNTCRFWDAFELSETPNGDLSKVIDKYPENTGINMKSGELAKISIFTPHECIIQEESAPRQFFRIVGKGVKGREPYFTVNPLLN